MAVCEMCGASGHLVKADVEGVELSVCSACSRYGKVRPKASSFRKSPKKFSPRTEVPQFRVMANCAAQLQKARQARGMDQTEFAHLLNEKESVLAKWESGAMKPPIPAVRKIEKILGLHLVEKITAEKAEIKQSPRRSDVLTLGDMIKIKQKKSSA